MATEIAIGADEPSQTSLVGKKTVVLTNDQIKALPTTPIDIVPAPGADKCLLLVCGIVKLNTEQGAYTNIDGYASIFTLNYMGGGLNIYQASNSIFFTDLNNGGSPGTVYTTVSPQLNPDGNSPTLFLTHQVYPDGQIVNFPLSVTLFNEIGGNLTGGHAANTMSITIYYMIADL